MKELSCDLCFSGKAIGITYSECVFVALRNNHAIRMRRTVTCDLLRSTIRFSGEVNYWKYFWFSLQLSLIHFSFKIEFSEIWSTTHIGLHVKHLLILSDWQNKTCLLHQCPEPWPLVALQPFRLIVRPVFLEVSTVAVRCLHVLRDARDPSGERENFNGR
jgi:hypothetical protein